MKVLAVLAVVILSVSALPSKNHNHEQWEQFKTLHARVYEPKEDSLRREIFLKNLEIIQQHNERFAQGLESFEQGVNQFSDLTEDELKVYAGGLVLPSNSSFEEVFFDNLANVQAPASLDLRSSLPPIKNQGQCGACWAFATVGSIEAAYSVHRSKSVSLSEQQLVDCVKGADGCGGGIMDTAYAYIKQNGGIESEADYPYQTKDGFACRAVASKSAVTVNGFVKVSASEDALLAALVANGPIAVAIDATAALQRYKSGIFFDSACSPAKLNHAVTLVGYGTDAGQDYWLIRNSWGTVWGEAGYGRIARNRSNHCGIASHATYPNV